MHALEMPRKPILPGSVAHAAATRQHAATLQWRVARGVTRHATAGPRTLMKPMSLARSRKHWRQIMRPYLRMMPQWLAHTRLHQT